MVDWIAVGLDRHDSSRSGRWNGVEAVAKPAVVLALIGVALWADGLDGRWLVVAALASSLVGDLALLPQVDRFLTGLGAFLVSHLLWLAALLASEVSGDRAVVAFVVLFGVVVALVARLRALPEGSVPDGFLPWIVIYGLVLAAMSSAAVGATPLLATGGVLFAISDSILAWRRFVSPSGRWLRVATHVTYHAALTALVVGFAVAS